MRSLGIRLGIVVVIAVGLFALRPFLSGNAGELAVGDCFDPPTTPNQEVKDVQHHPCADVHHGEVIFVGKIEGFTTYPTDPEFSQFVQNTCLPAYTAYTGTDLLTTVDSGADMGYFVPTTSGWTGGDRSVTCYATRRDDGPMQGSVKKA